MINKPCATHFYGWEKSNKYVSKFTNENPNKKNKISSFNCLALKTISINKNKI